MVGRPAVALLVALSLVAGPARASEPTPPGAYDTVVLRDGTVLRGTVREHAPGRVVVIEVGAGDTRTLAWADVASTTFAGTTRPEGPAPADMAPEPVGPRIFIESTRPVEVHLYELTPPPYGKYTHSAKRLVCRAPCGQIVDGSSGNPFQLGGDGITSSKLFHLKDLEGDHVLHVRPGRTSLGVGGFVATVFGTMGIGAGSMMMLMTRRDETRIGGGMVLGAGVALLVAGIVLLARGITRYKLVKRR
jgi:hypothetical protein